MSQVYMEGKPLNWLVNLALRRAQGAVTSLLVNLAFRRAQGAVICVSPVLYDLSFISTLSLPKGACRRVKYNE